MSQMHQVKHMALQFPCSFELSISKTPYLQANNQMQLYKSYLANTRVQKCLEQKKSKQKAPKQIGHCTSLRMSGSSTKTNLQLKFSISSPNPITDKFKCCNLLLNKACRVYCHQDGTSFYQLHDCIDKNIVTIGVLTALLNNMNVQNDHSHA